MTPVHGRQSLKTWHMLNVMRVVVELKFGMMRIQVFVLIVELTGNELSVLV